MNESDTQANQDDHTHPEQNQLGISPLIDPVAIPTVLDRAIDRLAETSGVTRQFMLAFRTAHQSLHSASRHPAKYRMRLLEITIDVPTLQAYGREVIAGGGVLAVWLIGSATRPGNPNDIDILYVLDYQADPAARDDDEGLLNFLETNCTGIDAHAYDSFYQAGQTFWHASFGAGASLMRNDEYAAQQARAPKLRLA